VLVGGFLGHDAPVDPDRFDQRADRVWTRSVLAVAGAVFGLVGLDAVVRRGWAGLYPSTPDRHPIVDRVRDGLYLAVGFAGTGLMMSPGAGRLCAELLIDGAVSSIDPTPLSAGRFSQEAGHSAELSGF
jgi:sarcosine oxidase, subunit beta